MIPVEVQHEFYKNIKKSLMDAKYPASYNYDFNRFLQFGFNCYSYAMQLRSDYEYLQDLHDEMEYPYNPGYISGLKPNCYTANNLSQAVADDCKSLGIQIENSNLEEVTSYDEYKIAIYLNPILNHMTRQRDYHFLRQNDDLTWSHMNGVCGEISRYPIYKRIGMHELVDIAKIKRN